MDEPTPDVTALQGFDQSPQVGQVELDRYCAGCGYNLRQQPVRREPTTQLLLCKCPECGAFEPANQATTRQRSWFAQLVFVLWLIWIAAMGAALASAIGGTANLSAELGELFNETKYLDKPIEQSTGAHTRTVNFQYQFRALDTGRALEMTGLLASGFAIGAGLLALALIFTPHWSRRGYALLALGWPIAAMIVFYGMAAMDSYVLDYATPGLKLWIFLCPLLVTFFAIVGGMTAITLTRPLVRLAIRIILPPRQRGPFAYLWLVDDKVPK